MSRKQSAPSVGPIGRGAESAHGTGQSNPVSNDPELVTARPPSVVGGVGREALPEWVRRRATSPEGVGPSLTPEPTDFSAQFLTVAELAKVVKAGAIIPH